jgi:hypothetical protein
MKKYDSGNNDKKRRARWDLFSNWIFANGIGAIGGSCIMIFVALSAGFFGTPLPQEKSTNEIVWSMFRDDLLLAIYFGGTIGVAQWFILRKELNQSGLWIFTSAAGMFVGLFGSDFLLFYKIFPRINDLFLVWILFGGVAGILQWLILKRHVAYAGLWILANIIAGSIAGLLWPYEGIFGGSVGWAVCGVIPGAALLWLFREDS